MGFFRTFLVFFAMVACSCGDDGSTTLTPARTIAVEGGGHSERLQVELATTEKAREQGLMFRQSLEEDRGMLFLFPTDVTVGFWMKNTYVPLTIAYLAADGTVLEVREGKPLDETVLTPARPYRMVLEVNQGWFARHGLGVGATVRVPADLPKAQ
ncbi:MAG: DUF192 domain-containing protein [Dehalococcoidia bacterium]|nr:DUF192 domain-containing protein [Dehalococcoidia bacterium]